VWWKFIKLLTNTMYDVPIGVLPLMEMRSLTQHCSTTPYSFICYENIQILTNYSHKYTWNYIIVNILINYNFINHITRYLISIDIRQYIYISYLYIIIYYLYIILLKIWNMYFIKCNNIIRVKCTYKLHYTN